MKKGAIYIGVDPAFRRDGFRACVVDYADRTVRFLAFDSVLHWHDWLRSEDAPLPEINLVTVIIENSYLQNQNFDLTGSRSEIARKGRNVGTNQAVSQLAYQSAIGRYGKRNVFEVSPRKKGAKWTDVQAKTVAMGEGLLLSRSNQDERDAFKLAMMGRNLKQYEQH